MDAEQAAVGKLNKQQFDRVVYDYYEAALPDGFKTCKVVEQVLILWEKNILNSCASDLCDVVYPKWLILIRSDWSIGDNLKFINGIGCGGRWQA